MEICLDRECPLVDSANLLGQKTAMACSYKMSFLYRYGFHTPDPSLLRGIDS